MNEILKQLQMFGNLIDGFGIKESEMNAFVDTVIETVLKDPSFKDAIEDFVNSTEQTSDEKIAEFDKMKEELEDENLSDFGKEFIFKIIDKVKEFFIEKIDNGAIRVYIELLNEDAKVPTYAKKGDAGMDVYAISEMDLKPGETKIMNTGFKVAIPEGYEFQVRPRSGNSIKTSLRIANAPGTIDSGYRGEVGIICQNISNKKDYKILKGDKIAQLVLQKVPIAKMVLVESVSEIGFNREGGFGSTGR